MSRTQRWFVPDAYIPPTSTPPEVSHESICVLNESGQDASLQITAYFADREPERSDVIVLGARRAVHLRTDNPEAVGGLQLERGVPYGLEIESETDLQVQYSRLDSTQAAYALMTAMLTATPRSTDHG